MHISTVEVEIYKGSYFSASVFEVITFHLYKFNNLIVSTGYMWLFLNIIPANFLMINF